MSSLSLSILILAVLVAIGIAAQSLWVLRRDKSRSGAVRRPPTNVPSPVATATPVPAAPAAEPGEPRLSLDDIVNLPEAEGPALAPMAEAFGADTGKSPGSAAPQAASGLDDLEAVPSAGSAATSAPAETGAAATVATAASAAVPGDTPLNGLAEGLPPGVRALHDDADCLVEIPLLQATSGDRLLGLTKSIRRAGGKPVAFEGLTVIPEPRQGEQLALPTGDVAPAEGEAAAPAPRESQWEALRHGVSYKRLRAGILLSNRQGPLNAMEFSEFTTRIQGLAGQLGVPVEFPEMNATLQRARSLDGLLADCDVQLGLAVDCSHPLRPQDLAVLAKRLGLFERGNNRFACLSENGEVIYSVALGDKAQRLQLMFDVPRVTPAHMPWWKMAEAAHQAAVQFEGRITDDGGKELSEQSFRNVAIALEGRQQALAEAGVPAGSALAMRVFN